MDFPTGTYIAIAAALLFYLRLIILQRQKVKQQRARPAYQPGKKRGKAGTGGPADVFRPALEMRSKLLVILGAALLLLGALLSFLSGLDPAVRSGWWLPVTIGILLMSLGIR